MSETRPPSLLTAALLLLVACAVEPLHEGYAGDGTFVDHGPRAAIRRYVVDLGELDLERVGSRQWAMAGLPAEELIIGLQIRALAEPAAAIYETHPLGAHVRLELADEQGQLLLAKEAPLDQWTWSGRGGEKSRSFVYWRGEPGDSATQPGKSSFTPRPGGRYRVTFTVLQPDPAASGYAVVARALGGGWKR